MDKDEYPEVTQSDLDRAVFRRGLKSAVKKVFIPIDADIVESFKIKAGENDFQQLINDALKKAVAA